MYNVKTKIFLDSTQTQVFRRAIPSKGERSNKRGYEPTGEDITGRKYMDIPFEKDVIFAKEIKESEYDVKRSMRRTVNMIYDYSRSNDWKWFLTLTLNPEKVNRFDYQECSQKFAKWLNNMRRNCPDMKYLVVPEQHKDGAWHFHGLFADCDGLGFVDSGHKDRKSRIIWNVGKYRLGFSTATQITDLKKTASYICKYITKELCIATQGRKRYWVSRNLDKPVVIEDYSEIPFICRKYFCKRDAVRVKFVKAPYNEIVYIDKDS